MRDTITLRGLKVRGHHGVFGFERRDGQDFLIDLELTLDLATAAASDDVADTVHYGEIAEEVAEIVGGDPYDLIESVAERIAEAVLRRDLVHSVTVTVHKPHAPIEQEFADVSVTVRRTSAAPPDASAVLALGANLGRPLETLRFAVATLDAHPQIAVTAKSRIYASTPVGGVEQPDYLNAVVLVRTTLEPGELLAAVNAIEAAAGRERVVRWGARTLDIDVIDVTGVVSREPRLTLPHPRAAERAFVLVPWSDVDPEARLDGRPIASLAVRAEDRNGLRPTTHEWEHP